MKASVKGISVMAPGLNGWQQAVPVLQGAKRWVSEPMEKLKPALLPPNERRRTTSLIKLALQAAEEAQQASGIEAETLACVFASCDGDTFIVDRLCQSLAMPGHPVSPIQFHNSVHNAAAGYWAIASGARRFSTSISAGAATFTLGLLEALAYVATENEPVLLVCYDEALPGILAPLGLSHETFATALVLAPEGEPGMATLAVSAEEGSEAPLPAALETLRQQNPVAEALPLLRQLARGESGNVSLLYLDGARLGIEVRAC